MTLDPTTEVATTSGRVAGRVLGAVTSWLGVPYAAPPVGPLRFRAPVPAPSWEGVRPADRVGGASLQPGGFGAARRALGSTLGEDCLYLNVSVPTAARRDGRLRPVLVWVHGGSFTSGSGGLYDGRPLAVEGDVVVVTLNYRLGVFGFVDLGGAADADVPSNLGLRDVLAACTWVQENIAAFGGDPARVTLAGESAGSIAVSLLLASRAGTGLFRAAITQSGTYSLTHGPDVRLEVARFYLRLLGIGPGDGERLRQLPAAQLAAAQAEVGRNTPGTLAASPWFDDDLVPGSLDEAQRVVRPEVALLAGHNHDEVTMFQRGRGDIMPTTREALTARLRAALGWEEAERLLARYPSTGRDTTALGTDLNFAMPTRHLAERQAAAGAPTYFYRFDAAVPLLGATHASELVYLWRWRGPVALLLRGRDTPARQALGERLRGHWLAFVRDGAPGPGWPAHRLPERATQVFNPAGDHVVADPGRERREAWAGRDVLARS